MTDINSARVVTGDILAEAESDYILGHGTVLTPVGEPAVPRYIASVAGVVTRINKLITVLPHTSRYAPEVGDVVVGRVVDLGDSRWRVDVNGRQLASLLLSSVNLPGAQRRRTDEDALHMRSFLAEGHVLTAEVQKVMADRSVSLHTRSAKYGRVGQGVLVAVPASLVRRSKLHFHSLPALGVDMVIGANGYVWLAPTPSEEEAARRAAAAEDDSMDRDRDRRASVATASAAVTAAAAANPDDPAAATAAVAASAPRDEPVSLDVRESIARLRASLLALAQARRKIHVDSVLAVYNASVALNVRVPDMSEEAVAIAVTQGVGQE